MNIAVFILAEVYAIYLRGTIQALRNLISNLEAVTYIPHSLDKHVVCILHLAAKPTDMHVHRPSATEILIAPNTGEQFLSGEDAPGVRRKQSK